MKSMNTFETIMTIIFVVVGVIFCMGMMIERNLVDSALCGAGFIACVIGAVGILLREFHPVKGQDRFRGFMMEVVGTMGLILHLRMAWAEPSTYINPSLLSFVGGMILFALGWTCHSQYTKKGLTYV